MKIKTNLYCIKFQFVPHREHDELRLRLGRLIGERSIGKYLILVVRIIWNT